MKTNLFVLMWMVAGLAPLRAAGQTATFLYQGRLTDHGAPASGTYEFRFTLHTATTGANSIGPTLAPPAVEVVEGQFALPLDFGSGVFTGPARWLEIGVRTNGAATPHVILTPRQLITATPYALHAQTASHLLGTVAESQLPASIARLNAPATFGGSVGFSPLFGPPFSVNNTNRVARLNADLLDDLEASAFARAVHTHSAADLVAGLLPDARLSSNVALLASNQIFRGTNRFAGVFIGTNKANVFAGDGAGLTNLNAAAIAGVLPANSLPPTVARLVADQTFSGQVLFAPDAGAPFRVARPTLVTNLNADRLDGLSAGDFWTTAGNRNAPFLGTLDDAPLELRVNNLPALRLLPHPLGATLIAGHPANTADAGVGAAIIAGGARNNVSQHYAFIGGGVGNRVSAASASVVGGENNAATNSAAAVVGGTGNIAGGVNSFAAGTSARAIHAHTFVWADGSSVNPFVSTASNQLVIRATGGVGIGTNAPQAALHVAGELRAARLTLTTGSQAGAILVSDADGQASWQQPAVRASGNATSPNTVGGYSGNGVPGSVLGGTVGGGGAPGASNVVTANYGTVAGGRDNVVGGLGGAIGGGESNRISNALATVSGGSGNVGGGTHSTVSGGQGNSAATAFATIGGGRSNLASAAAATVAGGQYNLASGASAVVAGGQTNLASGALATLGGGDRNTAAGASSTIGGGLQNTNNGLAGVVSGGRLNRVTQDYATVPGGEGNVAGGTHSFAAGRRAQALHAGSFVWADAANATDFASTAPHQFLIRAAGGVGIGAAPQDAQLDVEGELRVNDFDLLFRGGTDRSAGLGWYGADKLFAGVNVSGPVLYGLVGGALGTRSGGTDRIALSWTSGGRVGIGTEAPSMPLHVVGADQFVAEFGSPSGSGTQVSIRNSANGGRAWRLVSTGPLAGGGAGQFQIRDTTNPRLTIDALGSVGLGTVTPSAKLEVVAPDATIRLRDQNADGLGGFVQNTSQSVQLGLYNAGSANVGQVGIGVARSFFGFNSEGWVGSLNNNAGVPDFRNLLDDGSGNMRVSGGGTVSFGETTRQMLNLWRANYGVGVQANTLYFRTDGNVAWYRSGSHNSAELNTGGGTELMRLNGTALRVRGAGAEDVYIGGDNVGNDAQFGSYNASITNAVMWNAARNEAMNLTVKALNQTSDRAAKQDFAAVDPDVILAKVADLPLATWRYRGEPEITHLGPVAQDFHASFGLGADDKHIATVDADGVALAAIQGLNRKLETELGRKQAEIDALRQVVKKLETLVSDLATRIEEPRR